jgi:hypothetical protein
MEALNNKRYLEVCSDINDGAHQVVRPRKKNFGVLKLPILTLWFQN